MRRTPQFLLLAAVSLVILRAQSTKSTFGGFTPKGLEPGSPAGSYALSGLDTVNLYNGTANIAIPLLQVGGRGEAGYTIQANVTKKPWNVTENIVVSLPCTTFCNTTYSNAFDVGNPWTNIDIRYKPAMMAGRSTSDYDQTGCTGLGSTLHSLTRITALMGDGSEIELVDQATMGRLNTTTAGCTSTGLTPPPLNRGPVWVSTDASSATFVQDNNQTIADWFYGETSFLLSGTLYFRDGRQFHFTNGFPTTITDRNGNQTKFDYSPSCSASGDSDPNAPHCTVADPGSVVPVVSVDSGSTSPYADPSQVVWAADSGFSGAGNSILSTTNNISFTSTPTLYQTARLSGRNVPLTYTFNVPNGSYEVSLKFAQIDMARCSVGSQTFHLAVNEITFTDPVDVSGAVSGCNKPYDFTPVQVTVTGGSILIVLTPVNDYAFVNAIQIVPAQGVPPNRFDVIDSLGRHTKVRIGTPNPETAAGHGYLDTITSLNGRTVGVYTREYWNDCPLTIGGVSECNGAAPDQITLFPLNGNFSPVVYTGTYKIQIPSTPSTTYNFLYNKYAEIIRMTLPTGGALEFDWQGGAPHSPTLCAGTPPAGNLSEICGATLGSGVYQVVVTRQVAARREYTDSNAPSIGAAFPAANYTRLTTYTYNQLSHATGIFDPFTLSGDAGAALYACANSTVPGTPSYPGIGIGSTLPNYCSETDVKEQDPSLGVLSYTQHFYYGSPINGATLFPANSTLGYSAWMEGKEFRTAVEPAQNGTALRDERQTWQSRPPYAWWTPSSNLPPPAGDPRLVQPDQVIDGGKMARHTMTYSADAFNNVTDLYEYKYGGTDSSQGDLLRRTHTDYRSDYNALCTAAPCGTPSYYLLGLASAQTIYNAASGMVAQTAYGYDEGATPLSYGDIVSNIATAVAPGKRGNVTTVNHWRNTDGALLSTVNTYDVAGNVLTTKNPRLYTTTYSFTTADCPGMYAFPASVTNAKSQSTLFGSYLCPLGKPQLITDPAGTQTGAAYSNGGSDTLDRLSLVTRAQNQAAHKSNTTYQYSSDLKTVNASSDRDNLSDGIIKSSSTTDRFGRVIQTVDAANVTSKQDLDGLGRLRKKYNPGSTTDGTVYTYDALGRATQVTYADGSIETSAWTGDTVVLTDPAGAQRQQTLDAFGRITQVVEDPSGKNWTTTYGYDELDDLTSVVQGSETRSFAYDSLKQLIRATNPEIGGLVTCPVSGLPASVCYTYDANGNLYTKLVPGASGSTALQTTYAYDPLDRLSTRTYSGGATADATNPVSFFYDTVQVGCLDSSGNGTSTTSLVSYDPYCRVTASTQTTAGKSYDFQYSYNRAGALLTETYPSAAYTAGGTHPPAGHTVTTGYDTAGRPLSITGNGATATYASNVGYAPHGAVNSVTLGNNLVETILFNKRLQPTSITAGSLLTLQYSYCPGGIATLDCATDTAGKNGNNGNVLWHTVNDGTTPRSQSFTYDGVNRLFTAQEGSTWNQTYAYDQYGNRALLSSSTDPSVGMDKVFVMPTSNVNVVPFDAFNHWTFTGAAYDQRGNLKTVQLDANNSYQGTFDAENRQVLATATVSSVGKIASYSYDGDGRRVTKTITGGATVTYVYDALGNLAQEYSTVSNPDSGTQFLTEDQLGSTRLISKAVLVNQVTTPGATSRSDYLPFGQEIPSTWNRGGYVADAAETLKFTGKERDAETELDFFEARYTSSAQGRFTSPDGPFNDQSPSDPQSWNLYSYVRNNPLGNVDPTGKALCVADIPQSHACEEERARANATISAVVLPQANGPLDRPIGFLKKSLSEAIDVMSVGNPNETVMRWLRPSTVEQKKGESAFNFVAAAMLPFDVAGAAGAAKGARTWIEAGISASDALRIQNAADRTRQTIIVVGSRAAGTANPEDWDYLLSGASAARHSAESSLPSGLSGGALKGNSQSGIDIWQTHNPSLTNFTTLDPNRPHVVFSPKK